MLSLSFILLALPSILSVAQAQPVKSHRVATAWYAGWRSEEFPLSSVSWDKYTQLTYSFAETTPDVNVLSLANSNEELLPEFVKTAKENGVKASVSIGGWSGSRFFSTAVATEANRTAFVKTVADFADKYQLDAIDFDWEYPGRQGLGCNTISPQDTENFLAFLQEFRKNPTGSKLTISAATSVTPFASADGTPSTNVTGFAQVFDHIAIMNYDLWGSWSNGVGPNAPLDDTCETTERQQGSAVSAVKMWTDAGIPAEKLVLGVPAYGRTFKVIKANATTAGGALAAYPNFEKVEIPANATLDLCGVPEGPVTTFDFRVLIDQGYLTKEGKPAEGMLSRVDECSKTSFVYDEKTETMLSYDDANSFAAKGEFIKSQGLAGFAMWEASGDSEDILLDSIRAAVGFDGQSCFGKRRWLRRR